MSDEVSDFLRSVEELQERDQQDEARSRELEEKFLQERRERQARRAGEGTLPVVTPAPISPFLLRPVCLLIRNCPIIVH
jgi:hypothetical protein